MPLNIIALVSANPLEYQGALPQAQVGEIFPYMLARLGPRPLPGQKYLISKHCPNPRLLDLIGLLQPMPVAEQVQVWFLADDEHI